MKKLSSWFLVFVMVVAMSFILIACEPEEPVEEPVDEPEEEVDEEVVEEEPVDEPEDAVSWGIGASSSGSASYYEAGAISRTINNVQDKLSLSPQVTAGFGEHPTLVEFGEVDMALVVSFQLMPAWEGEGEYREPHQDIRVVTGYGHAQTHLMARADSGVESLDDLEGKRVNIGTPTQTMRMTNDAMLEALGYTYDDFDVFELGTGDALDALRDGVIDVMLGRATPETPAFVELSEAVDLNWLEVPEEVVDELIDQGYTIFHESMPAGSYPDQDEEIPGWGEETAIIANVEHDEELVYTFTKAFWENWEAIDIQPYYDPERYFIGPELRPVPFHDGALRYYEEIGLVD